jgi:DivIVA domain-containing protein
VTLTPEDIERQEFKERFRGYDQDEVDRFLDRVAARIAELTKERGELSRRVREAERQAAEGSEAEHLLRRTLVAAQRTADETVAEARSQAEQALSDAREEAARLLSDARRDAAALATQASAQATQVRAAMDELRRFQGEYRERVRQVMTEQLALLERTGELPELPAQLDATVAALEQLVEPAAEEPRAGDLGG